jgi:hypothetical protein
VASTSSTSLCFDVSTSGASLQRDAPCVIDRGVGGATTWLDQWFGRKAMSSVPAVVVDDRVQDKGGRGGNGASS